MTSLDTGSGTLRAGSATLSALNVTGATTLDGDIRFVGAALRKIVFSGEPSEVPDSGEITWYSNDNDTSRNPWAQTDSNESGVLELKVTSDAVSGRSVYGDSIRLDGASGIYLKALDRVIASCKVERAWVGSTALDPAHHHDRESDSWVVRSRRNEGSDGGFDRVPYGRHGRRAVSTRWGYQVPDV